MFEEVQFYFRSQLEIDDKTTALALMSLYSSPDANLLQLSYGTVYSCMYRGENSLRVVEANTIHSVVVIVPFTHPASNKTPYFVVEKPGLELADTNSIDPTDVADTE